MSRKRKLPTSNGMKAVILAGGSGTRLQPLTLVTNKHLLPVYDKPVIYYAIEKLVDAGITKIMVVTSPSNIDSFVKLLGSGQRFVPKGTTAKQIQIVYGIQNEPNGIAYGLLLRKITSEKTTAYFSSAITFSSTISRLSHTEIQKARPCSSKSARPEAVWYRYREARQNHLARGKTRQAERRHGRDGTLYIRQHRLQEDTQDTAERAGRIRNNRREQVVP